MINKNTLTFLRTIKKNNNKEWFDKNKERYLSAKDDVAKLIDDLLKMLCKTDKRYGDLSSKDCVYRIYRDIRFSTDKTPYKANLGASINIGGKKAVNAGYYIHIEPGNSFIAGGMWMPGGDLLKKIRQEIEYNAKDFRKILGNKDFKKYYGTLDQEYALKTAPRGYEKDHPEIEFLRMNSYIVWHGFKDSQVQSKNFVNEIAKGAKIMKPFLDFLNVAIT